MSLDIKKSVVNKKPRRKSEGSSPIKNIRQNSDSLYGPGTIQLLISIRDNDLKMIKFIMESGHINFNKFDKKKIMEYAIETNNDRIIEYLSKYFKQSDISKKQIKYTTSPFSDVFLKRKSPRIDKNIGFIGCFTDKNIDSHFFDFLSTKYKNSCNIYCFRDIYNITENEQQSNLIMADFINKKWSLTIKFNIQLFKEWVFNCNKNYIIIPIRINGYHANVLIINKYRHELERFEPHGYKKKDKGLDKLLEKLSTKLDLRYISMGKGLSGLQNIQSYEQYTEKLEIPRKKDPEGFCVAWSLFYAHLRLSSSPNEWSNHLIYKAIKHIRKKSPSYTRFIRNYTNFIINSTKYFKHDIKKCPKTTQRARSLISFKSPKIPKKRRYSDNDKLKSFENDKGRF